MTTIDMQTMRYINILDRASKVKTSKCFVYNNIIIFAVPSSMMSRAIGPGAANIKNIQNQLGKKVKIIREASGIEDAERFILDIVNPIKFKSLDIQEGTLIINSGNIHNKASLMGRNKTRMDELATVVKDTFNLELKIM